MWPRPPSPLALTACRSIPATYPSSFQLLHLCLLRFQPRPFLLGLLPPNPRTSLPDYEPVLGHLAFLPLNPQNVPGPSQLESC